MEISVLEALDLLEHAQRRVVRLRDEAKEAAETRDALIRELDGQPGMLRRDMAARMGMTKQGVLTIANHAAPLREALVDGVPMDQTLYDQLVAVIGQFARTQKGADAVRLDVSA